MFPFRAISRSGIVSVLASGILIATCSLGIVRADRLQPLHPAKQKTVFTCSTGTSCLEGKSSGTTTAGVLGNASTFDGVFGQTSTESNFAGVFGESTASSGSGSGVVGSSSNGYGVAGQTFSQNGSYGVYGVSLGSGGDSGGVYGFSPNSNGTVGETTAPNWSGVAGIFEGTNCCGNGVFGSSTTGTGVEAISNGTGTNALLAEGGTVNTALLLAYDEANGDNCLIDPSADLTCTGTIGAVRRDAKGRNVLAYAAESASQTLEDAGTASLVNGIAEVAIKPDFAAAIDRSRPYHVFLTPLGDTNGLYVRHKSASSFEVREVHAGRSSISFDFRVLARPLGAASAHLPLAPLTRRPPPSRLPFDAGLGHGATR